MSERPLVSVVLPAFNRADVVRRAMDSVLSQSYRELELIVVDDGSTDDTETVVKAVADARVRYVHRANGGAGAARNTGIAAARGEFIAFQDSDDEWLPDKLKKQMDRLMAAPPDVGVMLCGHRELRPDAVNEMTIDEYLARGDARGSLLTGLWYVPPTWIVRRAALERAGPFDEALPSCEDWDLAFRLSDACRFDCVPEILIVKHHTHGSVFDHATRRVEGFRLVLERHRHRWRAPSYWLARQEFVLGYWTLRELKQRWMGLHYLAQAVLHHPASQASKVVQVLLQHRLRRYPSLRRWLGYADTPPSVKPVARVFTPIPLDPTFPNGFAERWLYFLQALSQRFEVELVAIRGVWSDASTDPDRFKPALALRDFCVLDAKQPVRWFRPFSWIARTLTELNVRRLGPAVYGARRATSPPPRLAIFLTHLHAHLAFQLPHETSCVFVLEEPLVHLHHANVPRPTRLVAPRFAWRAWLRWLSARRYARFIRRCGRRGPVVAISEREGEWFSQWMPRDRVRVIELGLDPAAYAPGPVEADHDIAIFGDLGQVRNYGPVLALVTRARQRSDAQHLRWLLVGLNPAQEIVGLSGPQVTVVGNVPDTRSFYSRAKAVVVPARIVTGSKTTLLKAWAMGRPVIATTPSASGTPARAGENLLIGDSDDEILDAALRVLRDPSLAAALGANGRATLERERNLVEQSARFAEFCVNASAGPNGILVEPA